MVEYARDQLQKNNNSGFIVNTFLSGSTTDISTTVVPCTVPGEAVGFRIYPTTNAIRFAVDADPVAAGTVNAATAGSIAKAGAWETRILPPGASTVRLLGTTATNVDIEWF